MEILAIQRDDYFLTGMMLAVNLVHGGPPPKFFSKLLFDTLVYDAENVKPSIEDIPESEFKQSLIRYVVIMSESLTHPQLNNYNHVFHQTEKINLFYRSCMRKVWISYEKLWTETPAH